MRIKAASRIIKLLPKAKKIVGNPERFSKTMKSGLEIVKGNKKFGDIQGDVFDLVHLARDTFKGSYRAFSKKNMLMIVAGILYLVNPLDMIPDFILGIGWTDDLAVLTYLISKFSEELERYRDWKILSKEDLL
ncbi:DUF1232 domain-containing protein [Peptoniphilus sp. KCTC 25270]|uniref:YkvA family protein n=1 Tax=Peptoniphilus sp. KCTC 25270 TaxID=2897414 RepID=UPI001E53EA97|nr:YkvA family protein [Peptoniphilus sp. KCTC 25270]MCD1146694.1 DUF1232 domain-containing protein [Peptoniphilus sp. KCTC 25270]